STVPVYNVSYSLAGALTPVDESKPQRALAQTEQLQSPLGGVPAFWPGTETSGMLAYSPDVPSSSEESFYGPESSSCSSLSPSPSPPAPAFLAVKEELPHSSLSTPSDLSSCYRAARGRPRRDKSKMSSLLVIDHQQYVCDICGVAFIRKYDGDRHRRSHTGERPFPCHGGCGKAFRRADARSRHWGVYRDCEWQHIIFIEGTPEGARRERRLLKRAKRAELVPKCILLVKDNSNGEYIGTLPPAGASWVAKEFHDNDLPEVRAPFGWAEQVGLNLALVDEFANDEAFIDVVGKWHLNISIVESYLLRLHHRSPERRFLCQRIVRSKVIDISGLNACSDSEIPAACALHVLSHYSYMHSPSHNSVLINLKAIINENETQIFSCDKAV
ncbi:hypothetical protein AURDEDRAFT_163539, partial [Auricularia subglabra TFB-10046 SS5]